MAINVTTVAFLMACIVKRSTNKGEGGPLANLLPEIIGGWKNGFIAPATSEFFKE